MFECTFTFPSSVSSKILPVDLLHVDLKGVLAYADCQCVMTVFELALNCLCCKVMLDCSTMLSIRLVADCAVAFSSARLTYTLLHCFHILKQSFHN